MTIPAMDNNPLFSHLQCRECGRRYPKDAIHVCEFDFGPLEAAYDYPAIAKQISRDKISARPRSMWRYRELLPIEGEPLVGKHTGFTPLVRRQSAGRTARGERTVHQERRSKFPDACHLRIESSRSHLAERKSSVSIP